MQILTFNIRLHQEHSFKPYYKWITFNIPEEVFYSKAGIIVLNLIINGLPSILMLNHQII